MGGHGGLNILPQKRWNVYNFDNREKVRLDEEAAAKEEQLKREQSRRRDSEIRLQHLRQARGLPSGAEDHNKPSSSSSSKSIETLAHKEQAFENKSESDSKHINLFEGIRIFDPIRVGDGVKEDRKKGKFGVDDDKKKKVKKEEVRVVGPEDEKYRLGYGVAGKGVKLPWYMEKRAKNGDGEGEEYGDRDDDEDDVRSKKRKSEGKKSLEELREERLKREKKEKERERALITGKSGRDGGFSYKRR